MSREIRRVPPDWKHPTREEMGWERHKDQYQPLYDRSYTAAAKEWMEGYAKWLSGELDIHSSAYYWEHESPPDKEHHRVREWTEEEATAYQIYEDVSEGTPVSPVFLTEDEMRAWLLEQGHSEKATDRFIKAKWVASMLIVGGESKIGIDSFDLDDY